MAFGKIKISIMVAIDLNTMYNKRNININHKEKQ